MSCGCDDKKITSPSTGCVDSLVPVGTPCVPCGETPPDTTVIQVMVPVSPCAPCTTNTVSQRIPCSTGVANVLCPPNVLQSVPGIVVPVRQQTAGVCQVFSKYSLKVLNSFNMPAFNGKANLAIGPSKGIAIGTILFNALVGWLKVTAYNKDLNTIDVLNYKNTGQIKSPGELIDACTEFALGTPDDGTGDGGGSTDQTCLLTDFFSPAIDVTGTINVTIEVSSVNGMQVGSRLSIGGYEYVIKQVISATVVVIYNAGAGAPAGTKVTGGLSCDGDCISIITILSADNPCDKTGVQEGVLLVCDGENTVPFTALNDRSIPVWDGISNTWKPEILNADTSTCTVLTADLTIDNISSTFVATVSDSSIFATTGPESLVAIEGKLFLVISIIDATHIEIDPTYTPAGVELYPSGTAVCVGTCCQCPTFSIRSKEGNDEIATIAIDTVGDHDRTTMPILFTLTNPSTCMSASYLLTFEIVSQVSIRNAGAAGALSWEGRFRLLESVDGGAFTVVGPELAETNRFGVRYDFERLLQYSKSGVLAPGQTLTLGYRPRITVATAPADAAGSDWSLSFGEGNVLIVGAGL